MRRLRFISACLLLAAFAVGGVAGPVLHWTQHAARQAAAADRVCHNEAVHTAEDAVWTHQGEDLFAPDCDLCATRLLVVMPAPRPPLAPQHVGTTRVAHRSHVASASAFTDRFIRGPPSLPEARPATA
jgi:hypothetical protein